VSFNRALFFIGTKKIFLQATVIAEALCTKVNTTAPPHNRSIKALGLWGEKMPIKRLLERHVFPPELVVILGEVFEDVLRTLDLNNREDPLTELIAKKVIELAQSGERNPIRLKALTVEAFERKAN